MPERQHDHGHAEHCQPPAHLGHAHPTELQRQQHRHAPYTAGPPGAGAHGPEHHAHRVADFRRRFWVSLVLTIPVLAVDETAQAFLRAVTGLAVTWRFAGARWVMLGLSTVVYVYGGRPFLAGFWNELRRRQPGMATLISVAITAAFLYSAAVVIGLRSMPFF
jgi:Cu2+-exporting ATPase